MGLPRMLALRTLVTGSALSFASPLSTEHEDPPPPEQIRGTTPEQQETAEGQPVGGHDPLQVRLGEVEIAADGRQRDIDDREIDDRHEERNSQHGERASAVYPGFRLCIHLHLLRISRRLPAGQSAVLEVVIRQLAAIHRSHKRNDSPTPAYRPSTG